MSKRKFSVVIGNPPYQENSESDSTRMPPIYNKFMDAAYKIANSVLLITPARFLFNAGYTPKQWNEKMLNDSHFKVINYEQKSDRIFPNTDIKGGIVITYRDSDKKFTPIGVFTVFEELNQILLKVQKSNVESLQTIVYPALSYGLTEVMKKENPNSLDRLRTSAFSKLSEIFYQKKPKDGDYVQLLGLDGRNRAYRWIDLRYLKCPDNFEKYKVILPKSNGSGAMGETLSTPLVGQPLIGHTQSFISIGSFDNEQEAENALKYIKSKFARTMLGVLKITQDNPPEKWKYVPLQDFTDNSDIDWSKSIPEIDQQLYKKYDLSPEEIEFIETHVKEME